MTLRMVIWLAQPESVEGPIPSTLRGTPDHIGSGLLPAVELVIDKRKGD